MTDSLDTRFWDEPGWTTGQHEREPARVRGGSFERTRSHRVVRRDETPPTQAMTFDDFAPHEDDPWGNVDHWVEPLEDERPRAFVGVDPKVVRIGAVALVGVLMIPLAIGLREDSGDGVRSDTLADVGSTVATAVVADPVTTVVTVPITAAATVPATAAATPVMAPSGLTAAAAPQALAVAKPEEPACAGIYTVIANDFWNRFPSSSGATVQEWLQANNATADTPLYVGDELCIPPGAQAPAPPPPPTTRAPETTLAATTLAPATTQPPPTTAAPVVTAPPTTAAAPVATVATVARATPPDPATVEAIIREVWPDELEERALAIARRESGLNPEAHNWCCYGVFAIYFEMGRDWLPSLGITSPEHLLDARTNVQAAYHLYTLSGWQPWAQTDPG